MLQVASPNVISFPSPVGHYLEHFASMKTERLDFDRKNQLVSDYILPRRDFSVALRPNQLRAHRITNGRAMQNNERFAGFLKTYMIDRSRPNLLPSVKRGLAVAGRQTELDDDGINYLGRVAWTMFDHMMLPLAGLMANLGSACQEFGAFGNAVVFGGYRPGFGPVYTARPFHACWWSLNEHGQIDTLYFRVVMPIYRIIERWPRAQAIEGWEEKAEKRDEQDISTVLICTEPRAGGVAGRIARAKPYKYVCVSEEKKAILEESGFDSFPYAVFRDNPMPGQAYAEGIGAKVLPDVMVLNHLQQCIENAAEQKAMPPLAWPARMFPKPLDRRPGAPNAYNPSGIGLQRPDQAIIKLDFTGDINDALGWRKELIADVDQAYYVDLMNLRETGDMTAEEVNKRGDITERGFSSKIDSCEQPLTILGDRTLEGLMKEKAVEKAPQSVAGVDVDWEYAGPLKIAQMASSVQSTLQLINARGRVLQQDPAAAQAVDLETCLRTIHMGLGTPTGQINSKASVQAAREKIAEQQDQQHQADIASKVAGAAKDGAGAIGALAPQQGSPGPGAGAQFAPASPLSQPLAA